MDNSSINKLFTAILLGALLLSGCVKEIEISDNDNTSLKFSAQITEIIESRTSGNQWEPNDAIGIFAKTAGQILSTNSIVDGISNVKLDYSGTYFTTSGAQSIGYPADGSSVDFIAYYPYQSVSAGMTVPIDISDQTDLGAIDLLYSKNAEGLNRYSPIYPTLTFTHQLSRLTLNLESAEGVNLQNVSVSLSGVKSIASFSLIDASITPDNLSDATIDANITLNDNKAKAEIILLPVANITGITIKITANGNTYNLSLTQDTNITSLTKGLSYTYNVKLTGTDAHTVIAGYNEWPVTPDNLFTEGTTLVTHTMSASWLNQSYTSATGNVRNYTLLYSNQYKVAHWVAYPLNRAYTGNASRTDAWAYDPLLPQTSQPNLSSSWTDSYTRGHQLPSADRTSSFNANRTTFYYSNQTPQTAHLNGTQWGSLEVKARNWAEATDTLYVVTGIILPKPPEVLTYSLDKDGNSAVIPKAYYKALAKKVGSQYYTIGYRMDNRQFSETFESCRVTVTALELETGLTFFPKITDATIKGQINSSVWN